jgi:acetyl-CoA decarbonylase/synthase complex subunit gamma
MALTGLDIYKLLPKTNCKDCGFATCLAFAMALAQKKTSLDKCPHVTAQAKEALESAAQPPIKLVTIGKGDNKIEIGNETVMYRHEQKFHHSAGIGVLIEDTLSEGAVDSRISDSGDLNFERVGQRIGAGLICIKNSSNDAGKFLNIVKKVSSSTGLCLALYSENKDALKGAIECVKDKRPLVVCGSASMTEDIAKLAKEHSLPLAITASSLDEAVELIDMAKSSGVEEIIINFKTGSIAKRIQYFTFARRAALKKNFRPLGYPVMAFTDSGDAGMELAEAATYVAKYAGLVIVKNTAKEFILPLLVVRQDIYQDPQKPVQVEARIYEIGKVTRDSPVLITTNFSITYFTVAGEVESSKVPSYIMACDSEGMSVLTAWAAEKFTPEKITETIKSVQLENIVSHKKIVIPGYVSVMSGKLEEVSGWKVAVGPREASGIPNYLRSYR